MVKESFVTRIILDFAFVAERAELHQVSQKLLLLKYGSAASTSMG